VLFLTVENGPRFGATELQRALFCFWMATASTRGPCLSVVLASLPVHVGTRAAFAHRSSGWQAAVAVLRGLLYGLFGYATFFLVLAIIILHHTVEPHSQCTIFALDDYSPRGRAGAH
jgi:hypothetical protein